MAEAALVAEYGLIGVALVFVECIETALAQILDVLDDVGSDDTQHGHAQKDDGAVFCEIARKTSGGAVLAGDGLPGKVGIDADKGNGEQDFAQDDQRHPRLRAPAPLPHAPHCAYCKGNQKHVRCGQHAVEQ